MNKRQIIASLSKIANELDNNGLYKQATSITNIMKRLAEDYDDMRDSLLTPDQLSLVQKGIDNEKLNKIFMQYAKPMIEKQGHSGFSFSYLQGQVKNYFASTDQEKSQMMTHFQRKSNEDSISGNMNKHILELIELAQGFQDEHGVPNEVMRDFIEAL